MHSTNLVPALRVLNMFVMNIFHQCMDNNGEPEQQCQVTVCKEYHHFHFPFKKLKKVNVKGQGDTYRLLIIIWTESDDFHESITHDIFPDFQKSDGYRSELFGH